MLCVIVLLILTVVNLRGVRESGITFGLPTFAFVACMSLAIIIGLVRAVHSGGHPQPVASPPQLPAATHAVSAWLLLRAYANGCTAMTGVEAVSNGVPLFRKPKIKNATRTLTIIVAILGLLLIGVSYLSRAYQIGAMDQQQPGYQTILSQLVGAVFGRGAFYYVTIASILMILSFSANTSFADFPRVCRLLADDGFLPSAFANLGRRLVFSLGIVSLAVVSGLILIAFGGITERLIPLFAVGAFSAFTLSQAGMVVHWQRKKGRGSRTSLVINAVGATATTITLGITVVAKFVEGAWLTLVIVIGLTLLFRQINAHYKTIARRVGQAVKLQATKLEPPSVIVPINGWNRITEKALRFALEISDDVTALHVKRDDEDDSELRELWCKNVEGPCRSLKQVPRLEIVSSRYRKIYEPIIAFVRKVRKENADRLVAVVIPELVEPHWYEYPLHALHAKGLKAQLFMERDDRIVVISTPWFLRK